MSAAYGQGYARFVCVSLACVLGLMTSRCADSDTGDPPRRPEGIRDAPKSVSAQSVRLSYTGGVALKARLGKFWTMAYDRTDGVLYVPDFDAGDIKVLSQNGDLLRTIGRRGFGPNEFMQPCAIAVDKDQMTVYDFGRRTFFVYDRDWKLVSKQVYSGEMEDTLPQSDSVVVSGHCVLGDKEYDLFLLTRDGRVKAGLYSCRDFGLSEREYLLGYSQYLAQAEDQQHFYLALQVEPVIRKFARDGRLVKQFGEAASYYTKPAITKDHKKWSEEKDEDAYKRWYNNTYFLHGLFATSDFLGVLIRYNTEPVAQYWLQVYDLEGSLIHEGIPLPDLVSNSHFVDVECDSAGNVFILETIEDVENVTVKLHRYKLEKSG